MALYDDDKEQKYIIISDKTDFTLQGSTTGSLEKVYYGYRAKYDKWLTNKNLPYYDYFELFKYEDVRIVPVDEYPPMINKQINVTKNLDVVDCACGFKILKEKIVSHNKTKIHNRRIYEQERNLSELINYILDDD